MAALPTPDEQRDNEAYSLMRSAVALIPRGDWNEAALALERAAGLHAQAGRTYDESRCLQMAATLRRAAGCPEMAQALIHRAAGRAPADRPLAISIAAEQAEIAFAEERYEEALAAWTTALENARGAGLNADVMSAVLRRRGGVLIALRQFTQANADYEEAARLTQSGHGAEEASRVHVEEADALWQNGFLMEADQALARVEAKLRDQTPPPLLAAELFLLRARLHRAAGRFDAATECARRSRDAALEAVVPVTYLAASVELAEALDGQNNFTEAYGTLASAWATLSDAVGKDVAYSWVEPCLLACQLKWGEESFQRAKAEYESRRREEMKQKPDS